VPNTRAGAVREGRRRRRAGDTPLVRAVELTFALGWAAFWISWLVAAFFAKRGRILWSRGLGIRAVIAVIVIVLVRSGVFRDHALNTEAWRDGLGLVLFAIGLGSRSGPASTSGATGAAR
jgi:hypothetical protein